MGEHEICSRKPYRIGFASSISPLLFLHEECESDSTLVWRTRHAIFKIQFDSVWTKPITSSGCNTPSFHWQRCIKWGYRSISYSTQVMTSVNLFRVLTAKLHRKKLHRIRIYRFIDYRLHRNVYRLLMCIEWVRRFG